MFNKQTAGWVLLLPCYLIKKFSRDVLTLMPPATPLCQHMTIQSESIHLCSKFSTMYNKHLPCCHFTRFFQIIPLPFILNLPSLHPAILIKMIPFPFNLLPIIFRTSTIYMPVPPMPILFLNPFSNCLYFSPFYLI